MNAYETDLNLPIPVMAQAENAMLDPSERKAVIKVAPYSGMACGDRLQLSWLGLDAEGQAYKHEVIRYISDGQSGMDVVFIVPAVHIAALDGGSVEVYYTLQSAQRSQPVQSRRLQLNVGDARQDLLPMIANDAVGATLDPDRVMEGTLVTIKPYARMAMGDQVLLTWAGDSSETSLNDMLKIESFAVGNELSFWISPEFIGPNLGASVSLSYCVLQEGRVARYSETAQLLIGTLVRKPLSAPVVLEAKEGVLDLQEAMDGITVIIEDAHAEEGELVYLKCDGDYFNHREDREISRETAGQPLVFIVPYRFWREHRDMSVRVSYSVERLDDVSQLSDVAFVQVQS